MQPDVWRDQVARRSDAGKPAIHGRSDLSHPRLETLAQRLVYADDGTRWRVREALAYDVPGAEAPSCLIFDAGHVCRRVWRYPDQWTELPDSTLLEIIERPR